MNIESFKIIYNERVINPIHMNVLFGEEYPTSNQTGIIKPKFLEITFVDEDGEIKVAVDETFMFKFVRR